MISRKVLFFCILLVFALQVFGRQSSPEHKLLFEKAKFTMETKGDLKQAIVLFKEIIEKFPEQRRYAAESLFYIGLCYEKTAFSEAIKAYEQLVEEYADMPEQVAAARARLVSLRQKEDENLNVTKIEYPDDPYFSPEALSPDGGKIAGNVYGSGQNIGFYDLVTRRIQLVTHYNWNDYWTVLAVWSPDGKKISFVRSNWDWYAPNELMTSTLDGKIQRLVRNEKGPIRPNDWLSDGSAVVALAQQDDGQFFIGLVPAEGGDFKALHTLEGDYFYGMHRSSIDASPDGRHIVFSDGPQRLSQDIYCLSRDGRSLEVVTDHPANDEQPRWSPDGKHVVFLSLRSGNRALWGVRMTNGKASGKPFLIKGMGQGTSLLNWTIKGLAYQENIDIWDIFLMPVDPETGAPAGELELLDYSPSGRNRSPVWSPDGKHFAFFSKGSGSQPEQGYIAVIPAGGGQARLFRIPFSGFSLASTKDLRWIPDSRALGFSMQSDERGPILFRLTLATGEWETWPIPAKFWTRIEWGPGGDTFFYVKMDRDNEGASGIIERSLETGEERYVYRPAAGRGKVYRSPKISRDFKKLVVEEDDNILVVNLETGKARTIFTEGFSSYSWSTDGQKLLVLQRMNDEPEIPLSLQLLTWQGETLNTELTEVQERTYQRFNSDWSPDGKMIAIEVRSGKYETFVMKNFIPENRR